MIDFIYYKKKYKLSYGDEISYLKEDGISFDGIGTRLSLYIDKDGLLSIDFEPYYRGIKYSEIFVDFFNVNYYSFTINGIENFLRSPYYFENVISIKLTNDSLLVDLLIDGKEEAMLEIYFNNFLFTYESEDMIDVDVIDYISSKSTNKQNILKLLYAKMDDAKFMEISKADYAFCWEESFLLLKSIEKTLNIPENISYQNSEILRLYNHSIVTNHDEAISKSFSLVFSLMGDFQGSIVEDPNENWLVSLCGLSLEFSKEYKEALLEFYISYLTTKYTYDNPQILLLFLIIVMMDILVYPKDEIDFLMKSFYRMDYVKRYDLCYFSERTLDEFRKLVASLEDKERESILYKILESMIKESV